jgi:hypothetical protein
MKERSKEVREQAIKSVIQERYRQDDKWGIQRHRYLLWRTILGEEIGEMDKAWLHTQFGGSEAGKDKVMKEMVQACAVLLAMIETQIECGESFIGLSEENGAEVK